jgi:hypothetical protein
MKEKAGKVVGFRGFFKDLKARWEAGPVLDTPENIMAHETISEMGQLRLRQQYGNDTFLREHIRGWLQKLNEEGFFCKANSKGESILTESKGGNEVFVVTNTGLTLSVKGIERGELNLIIDGEKYPVLNSDPHYLKPMIQREMLKRETVEKM